MLMFGVEQEIRPVDAQARAPIKAPKGPFVCSGLMPDKAEIVDPDPLLV